MNILLGMPKYKEEAGALEGDCAMRNSFTSAQNNVIL